MGAMNELDIERKNTVHTLLNQLMSQQALFAETIQDKLSEAYDAGIKEAMNYTPFEELFEQLPTRINGYNNNYGFQADQNIGFAMQRDENNYKCYAFDADEPQFTVYRLHTNCIPLQFTATTAKYAVQLMINYLTENNLIQK